MVVHPAPGHAQGTLVNAFLHHCGLPPVPVEADTASDESSGMFCAHVLLLMPCLLG